MRPTALLLLLPLFAACAGGPEIRREPAVEKADQERRAKEADARRRDFHAVMVRLDQAMDSYVQALAARGVMRADSQAERLYKLINDTVLDRGAVRADHERVEPGTTFAELQRLATDASNPDDQAIALAALGFSGRPEVLPLIQQGTQLSDPFVVDRAVLGLAVLRAPATPPGVLEAIIVKPTHPEDGRVQAAWALYQIQEVSTRPEEIVAVWRRLLTKERDAIPAGAVAQAVRGVGLARDPANADLVLPYLKHPVPRVRMNAALAMGRMNAQQHWQAVLDLLGPQEQSQNVRLFASKALVDLAGGVDHRYDVAAWRKAFDRGTR